jgi:hypothetical protein
MSSQPHLDSASLPQRRPDGVPPRSPGRPRLAAVAPTPEPVRARLIARGVVSGLAALGETLVIVGLGTAMLVAYVQPHDGFTFLTYGAVLTAGTSGIVLLFRIRGLYTIEALLRPGPAIGNLAAAFMAVFAAFAGLMFLTKAGMDFSRVWLASWLLSATAATMLYRLLAAALLGRFKGKGQLSRRCVLVGGGEPARRLVEALEASGAGDIEIVGVFDDRDDRRSPSTVGRYRKLGTIAELVDFARRSRVDLLVVTFPLTAEARLLQVLKQLWVLPVDIRLSTHMQSLRFRPRAYSYVGDIPFLDLADTPIASWSSLAKAIEDKLLAGLALIGLMPLMLLAALAIKLDSRGPVLFRQKRYGFNNELIEITNSARCMSNPAIPTRSVW